MDWELIWWCAACGIALLAAIIVLLPWNEYYRKDGNDPYRYCPKDEN